MHERNETRQCESCMQIKPLKSGFYGGYSGDGGYALTCRECYDRCEHRIKLPSGKLMEVKERFADCKPGDFCVSFLGTYGTKVGEVATWHINPNWRRSSFGPYEEAKFVREDVTSVDETTGKPLVNMGYRRI